jgi:toxin ParE1/3/4
MNRRYFINILATQDLKEIVNYFTANNIEAGEEFFRKFHRRCKQLINFPNIGRNYSEIRPDLRGFNRQKE